MNQPNIENALKYHQRGDLSKAQKLYEAILKKEAQNFDALHLLGVLNHQRNRTQKAIELIQKALALNPNSASAYNNLANALKAEHLFDQAEKAYLKAIELEPDAARYNNLGNLLKDQKRLNEALTAYQKAIAIDAYRAEIYNNLGNVLQDMCRFNEAIKAYQEAIRINPNYADAYYNLSLVYIQEHKQKQTIEACLKVIQLQPEFGSHWSALLLSSCFFENISAEEVFCWAKLFGEHFETSRQSYQKKPKTDPDKKLRVGFVSGDLRHHPVGHFLLGALMPCDFKDMEYFAYANQYEFDELSQRLKECFSHWLQVIDLTDDELSKKIKADRIDILIDLSSHTANNRLTVFAKKPAPIQVSWLGGLMTTGLKSMDYIIVDPVLLPKDEAKYFTEKPWYLPDSFFCFNPPETAPNDKELEVGSLPALNSNKISFACFNNLSKVNDQVIACWSEILNRLPESQLIFKSEQLEQEAMRMRLEQRFAEHGIKPERLILEGRSDFSKYLAGYKRVDIALDPFPYSGGATSVQGLWMGVPVLKLKGKTFISHIGESILNTLDLTDWIGEDIEDYVSKALYWGTHLDRLSDLRQNLRIRLLTSPLCDRVQFNKHFKQALRDMWQKGCVQRDSRQ